MGVIHKLNQDVVDFVINYKKDNPSVSCRKLSDIVSEKFNKTVSKSSISTLLKNAQMSNSVGRPSGSKGKKEKFKIPEQKKQQLQTLVKKLHDPVVKPKITNQETSEPPKPFEPIIIEEIPKKKKVNDDRPTLLPDPVETGEPVLSVSSKDDKDEEALLTGDKEDAFFSHVKAIRQEIKEDAESRNALGFACLKAVLKEVFSENPLVGLVKNKITGDEKVSDYCDAIVMSLVDGATSFDDCIAKISEGNLYSNNLSNTDEIKKVVEALRGGAPDKNARLAYTSQLSTASLAVCAFVLKLEDGSRCIVDAQCNSVWSEVANGPWDLRYQGAVWYEARVNQSANSALSELSARIISNNLPCVINVAPGRASYDTSFFELIAAFGNVDGKRIESVEVIDKNGMELTSFKTLPKQMRTFIAGLYPQQSMYQEFLKSLKWPGRSHYYDSLTDKIFYYSQQSTDYFSSNIQNSIGPLLLIPIWIDKKSDPELILLTNDHGSKAETILKEYLFSWPMLHKGRFVDLYLNTTEDQVPIDKEASHPPVFDLSVDSPADDLWGYVDDVLWRLLAYINEKYMPEIIAVEDVKSLISSVCNLNGTTTTTSAGVKYQLNIPSSFEKTQELDVFVSKISENRLKSAKNTPIFVSVDLIS